MSRNGGRRSTQPVEKSSAPGQSGSGGCRCIPCGIEWRTDYPWPSWTRHEMREQHRRNVARYVKEQRS